MILKIKNQMIINHQKRRSKRPKQLRGRRSSLFMAAKQDAQGKLWAANIAVTVI
jgi:hypothetical protein